MKEECEIRSRARFIFAEFHVKTFLYLELSIFDTRGPMIEILRDQDELYEPCQVILCHVIENYIIKLNKESGHAMSSK